MTQARQSAMIAKRDAEQPSSMSRPGKKRLWELPPGEAVQAALGYPGQQRAKEARHRIG